MRNNYTYRNHRMRHPNLLESQNNFESEYNLKYKLFSLLPSPTKEGGSFRDYIMHINTNAVKITFCGISVSPFIHIWLTLNSLAYFVTYLDVLVRFCRATTSAVLRMSAGT